MITRYTSGGSAGSTIDQASGENDGPNIRVIGAVAIAAYAAYKVLL